MPGPKATWEEVGDAARRVDKATQTPAAMAWDRSGHRFAGPAGDALWREDIRRQGNLTVDAGVGNKTAVGKFVASARVTAPCSKTSGAAPGGSSLGAMLWASSRTAAW